MNEAGGRAPPLRQEAPAELFQAFDDEEVGEEAGVAVGVALSVGGDQDVGDPLDSGGVGGEEFLPELALPGFDVHSEDSDRNVAALPDVEGAAVRRETQRKLS